MIKISPASSSINFPSILPNGMIGTGMGTVFAFLLRSIHKVIRTMNKKHMAPPRTVMAMGTPWIFCDPPDVPCVVLLETSE